MLFVLIVGFVAASGFFLLSALTHRRLLVEATLARIPGYGYNDAGETDLRAVLRRIGRFAPGGSGAGADQLRMKIAAAGWSKHLTAEELAGLKVVLPLIA